MKLTRPDSLWQRRKLLPRLFSRQCVKSPLRKKCQVRLTKDIIVPGSNAVKPIFWRRRASLIKRNRRLGTKSRRHDEQRFFEVKQARSRIRTRHPFATEAARVAWRKAGLRAIVAFFHRARASAGSVPSQSAAIPDRVRLPLRRIPSSERRASQTRPSSFAA